MSNISIKIKKTAKITPKKKITSKNKDKKKLRLNVNLSKTKMIFTISDKE